jgi:DNA repair exonuclease SbcCD ATPase subunit
MNEQEIKEAISSLLTLWRDVEWWEEQGFHQIRPTLKAAADAARQLKSERDEWRRTAYEITEQANKMRDNLTEERDIVKADFEKVVGYNTRLQDELDKARAEVERLKVELQRESARYQAAINGLEHTSNQRDDARRQRDEILADRDNVQQERDEARAEVEERKNALMEAINQIDDYKSKFLLWFERAKTENTKLLAALEDANQARAEVERLKSQEVKVTFVGQPSLSGGSGGSFAGNDHIPDATKMIRPEPSRLEIAAMFKAAWFSNADYKSEDCCDDRWWIEQADALIEAAKGGAK